MIRVLFNYQSALRVTYSGQTLSILGKELTSSIPVLAPPQDISSGIYEWFYALSRDARWVMRVFCGLLLLTDNIGENLDDLGVLGYNTKGISHDRKN